MFYEWLEKLTIGDGVVAAFAGLIGWVTFQWRQSESTRHKTEERNSDLSKELETARSRVAEVEQVAIDLKNEMPTIVGEYFCKIDSLLTEGLERLRKRLQGAVLRVQELERELTALKNKSEHSSDDFRRLADEVENAHEEIEEVEALKVQLEQKHLAVSKTLPVLLYDSLQPEMIQAAEDEMEKRLRHSSALKTTKRVIQRERSSMTAKAAATNAKIKKMEEKIELLERKLNASKYRSLKIPEPDS